ncbi:DUF937 domain-containing protein [Deinococcus metallilatus]|uniref:DUF937 domain-containing protein n=1 Tax=Deinococcus metallilatus TaxID=1211322 RepID=A0AAJ5JZ67_9DEIO|nr:DUF937 domain-containing protein [Deinococcus metallilatus]MBB5296274.1 hypothetical protein [Deinococcus metallilatus]QBY09684.1 DUF937 domain-containing protein [Deinococcus metallilatus]RXJ08882.1 DUF937 domain-containing protein [Deinococcus metallilatus]TLK23739.1 DUF937 domain-containing protein [Deinococcus metallilatus]GMA14141.1 hypothetical protein GCM10025871_04720 [Deinococcus metallilatus]
MNVADLLESYFGPASAEQLGRATDLSAEGAARVLHEGLPLQLNALADHARTPEGQAQIAEALANVPDFPSVEAALNEPDGAAHLRQAGELLAPVLLGGQANSVAGQVAGGLNAGSVQQLLHMTLPLLLSFLGQRGLNAANVGSVLPALKGALGTAAGVAGGALTAAGLLDFLKGQFGGQAADQLGRAAGFTGGTATRAAQAALPVVLNAIANKGSTEAGAADLLARGRDLQRFTTPDGTLNTALLNDPAETARAEGQGRGLLGSLFPNVDAVTGRFGSAVGGSGTSAGRLLALMAPLVLSLVLGRARAANLKPAGLSGLLAGVAPLLPALLPAGLTSLGALLAPPPQVETVAAAVPPPPRVVQTPPPQATPAPPPVDTAAPVAPARRGGFPWWLIPLLLLLGLGGWWLLRQPSTTTAGTTTTGATGNGIVVTNPGSGATLPAEDFVMSGTAPAGTTLSIEDQGQPVASVNVGPDGKWQAAIPAPTPGEHTYTIGGQNGTRSEFKVNVTGASGSAGNATTGGNTAANGAAGSGFAITEPAASAQLPAGGFTLRGTGTPGQTVQVLEDGTSLGNATVAADGTWSLNVPSPAAGAHTYSVKGADGTELASVAATVAAASAGASAVNCTKTYTLSISDGQTVSQPFRFGGVGQGQGYSVTVKRGDRTVGTKTIPLDATCGWSYQSRPGAGTVTYEVRPLGDAAAAPLSTVTLTVTQ